MHGPQPHPDPAGEAAVGFRGATIAALFAAVMIAVSIPIITHPLPPLSDYVNHLATAHVVDAIDNDPDLMRFYLIDWQLIPDLMMDLVVPVLHRFMSIYVAGEIFTIAIMVGILSGTMGLSRALNGRWSVLPLLASPFLYNGVLLVGVMNYLAGIGLALWAMAAWIALREDAWPWRFAVSALFVLTLFFCHLFALGVYGLGLLAFETQRLWTRRHERLTWPLIDFVATGVPFLPALLLLVTGPTWDAPGVPPFWEFPGKIDGWLLVISIYERPVGYGSSPRWRSPPCWRRGGTPCIFIRSDGRCFWSAGSSIWRCRASSSAPISPTSACRSRSRFMLAACFRVDLETARMRQGFVALLALLLAVRLTEVQRIWNQLDRGPIEALRSVAAIDRGARVLVVHGDRSKTGLISDLGLLHVASLATIERSALVSTAFTVEGKHILQVREEFRPFVDTTDGTPPSIPYFVAAAGGPGPYYFNEWPKHYDYVYVLFTKPGDPNPDPARLAPVVAAARHFQLYRVIAR